MSIKYKIKFFAPTFFILFITGTTSYFTSASSVAPAITVQNENINARQQDRERKAQLTPDLPPGMSEKEDFRPEAIPFPHEENCYPIDNISLNQDSKKLHLRKLRYFTAQAEGKCLGINGIKLLAKTLQNEIIRLGYITTRVNLPEQNLSGRTLTFDIHAGHVGKNRAK